MNLMPFFKEYMKNYEGLDEYLVEIDGQSMYEWNYEDGCLFVGASRLYELTGDRAYLDFIVKMVSPYIEEDGTIKSYHREVYYLDFINAGKIFYFLYDETGEERYRKACDTLMTQLIYQPRLTTGNFWHKLIYPFQVWLDGLYMGQVLPRLRRVQGQKMGRSRNRAFPELLAPLHRLVSNGSR